MRRIFEILGSSLNLTWQEFKSHKVRTLLSLSGVAFGIFCIIGVLAAIDSMEYAIQKDIASLGTKTIYIDKWDYVGDDNSPWWKYMKRPDPKYDEMVMLKKKLGDAANIAFTLRMNSSTLEVGDNTISGVNYYGITEEFSNIQTIEVTQGRYLQPSDFDNSTNSIVMGNEVAVNLFGNADKAVGQTVELKGGKIGQVIGLIKKQGKSFTGDGWDYDNCIIMSSGFLKQMIRERSGNPIIMVQAKGTMTMEQLKDELEGAMRSIRKIKPTQDNDFTLNDIEAFSSIISNIFGYINKGGWAIAALSLVVGMFGVANIMFVTVRERTSQIGLKKAIGAKKASILTEFLLESAFLCIMGGILGLSVIYLLTLAIQATTGFTIFISPGILLLAVTICVTVGVLAGIIPATVAARMDPVVAIRSK